MDSLWNFWDSAGNIEGTSNWSKDSSMVNGQLFIIQDKLNRNLFLKKETWRVSNLSTIKMEVKHYMLNGQMEKDVGLGNIGIKTGLW